MPAYILRRILNAIPTLLLVSLVIFLIMSLSPIDPIQDPLLGAVTPTGPTIEAAPLIARA